MVRTFLSIKFDDFFNDSYAEEYFENKILNRNGGGRDNLTPQVYWEKYKNNTPLILCKCKNEEYRFTSYKEQLISRGRWKLPRCISIPTVRDRFVLGLLYEYLKEMFPECVNHCTPNQYIKQIKKYIDKNSEPICFFKSDFSNFYNNINQKVLVDKLKMRIHDSRPLKLITDAIQNPTTGFVKEMYVRSCVGIPQGLAISNILASIYMMDFDERMSTIESGLYLRYVDDILLLRPYFDNIQQVISEYLVENNMSISLSNDKTVQGRIGDVPLDYIGYVFKKNCITIRERNVDLFIRRLARVVTELRRQLENPVIRPKFISTDKQLVEYYTEEINELVSGMKYENIMYGWLPYFQECTDLQLFHRLDKILKKMLSKIPNVVFSNIHSFVDSYYDIRQRSGIHYVRDYDSLQAIPEKESFLRRKGWIVESKQYSEDSINQFYKEYCNRRKRALERNIGYFN